jgi:predicted NBD/HSP70 family sugar kinase
MTDLGRSPHGHGATRAEEILRAVHATPGITRATLARRLGMSSGAATDAVRRLAERDLLAERDRPATGERGRPTRALVAHPAGPVVVTAVIAHETWEVSAVALGGELVAQRTAVHDRDETATLAAVAGAVAGVSEQLGPRVQALGIAAPGTVAGTRLIQAPGLGWRDVELAGLCPGRLPDLPVVAGNDASLSALAEGRRGSGREASAFVYLYMDSGVGGGLVQAGELIGGSRGLAGEFGHLPFGDPARRCRCGALGCWNTMLDGWALADRLGVPRPADDVSFTRGLLAAAASNPGGPEAQAARAAAHALARGIAGLANALDPALVCLGGLAEALVRIAPELVDAGYRSGLMSTLADAPPPLRYGMLGAAAPRWGAADDAFDRVLGALARRAGQPTGG